MDHADFDPHEEVNVCSRCQRWSMVFLRRMTTRSQVNWYACTVCGHLVTLPRRNAQEAADNTIDNVIEH